MAAIDKIYLKKDDYLAFKEWCKNQLPLHDKYGKEAHITDYLWYIDDNNWRDENNTRPVMMAPYYVDAYIIRNCPIEGVQEELQLNYGYWSQERIHEFYENVKSYNPDKDGTITIKGLEKSSYEEILDGELYALPYRTDVEYGTHFKLIKSPNGKRTIPFERPLKGTWWVSVENTENKYDFMWYNKDTNTWDFMDEFVVGGGRSDIAYVKTITALTRKIRKWKLPIGTKVYAVGKYVDEKYEFIVTK